jgi:aminoglycoside phosphotransferase (APT) family kinase protein
VRPLRGGISSSVHAVRVEGADGERQTVVVRRYDAEWQRRDPAACEREFKLLTALAETAFPAPRPLLLEPEGGPFGAPTVIITRLPGRPLVAPRDVHDYVRQMACTLAELHALPIAGLDFLPDQRVSVERSLGKALASQADPLLHTLLAAARAEWARVALMNQPRVLLHGDYWPGNLLWLRGRLVGVVDWEQPCLGPVEKDVATCRGDLWILLGQEAADAFVVAYEQASGRALSNQRFWDVLVSTWAVRLIDEWVGGYHTLGRTDLTLEIARARIRDFARTALDQTENGKTQ